jgi:ABC-2 type transport system permease protein
VTRLRPMYGRFLGRALRISLAARTAYRGDFFLSLLVSILFEMVTPLVTVLIYGAGSSFPGWTMGEALLIQAVFLVSRGIAFPCFFGIVWVVFERVREGTFETTLLKPLPPLLVALAEGLDAEGFVRFTGGAALFAYALSKVPAPGLPQILLFIALLAVSLLVLFSFALLMSGSLFVWIGNGRVMEVMESVMLFAQYPASIYGQTFQLVLSVVIPAAMIAFFPAQALLGRMEPFTWISVAACAVFFLASLSFWRAMAGRYKGGGG